MTDLLVKNGIRPDAIKWKAEANGEDIDIVVEDYDTRVFIELKDKEFGLGDSYAFSFRLARYGAEYGVVATMDKVSSDAKKFLSERRPDMEYPVTIQWWEGAQAIEKAVRTLVDAIAVKQVRRTIGPISRWLGLDLWAVLGAWVKSKHPDLTAGVGSHSS